MISCVSSLWEAFFMVSGALFCTHTHTITHTLLGKGKRARESFTIEPTSCRASGQELMHPAARQQRTGRVTRCRGARRSFCTYSALPDINCRTRIGKRFCFADFQNVTNSSGHACLSWPADIDYEILCVWPGRTESFGWSDLVIRDGRCWWFQSPFPRSLGAIFFTDPNSATWLTQRISLKKHSQERIDADLKHRIKRYVWKVSEDSGGDKNVATTSHDMQPNSNRGLFRCKLSWNVNAL